VTDSLTLGRIAGIRIGIHWSWLVVFALITWSLASAVFPSQNPELSDGTHLGMAIVASVAFFLSLLLHELGHALQARREGMEIDGITLWLFGGVAQFRGQFPSAGAEFRIAVAGPLVSLVLGVLFLALAMLAALPDAADGVSFWLGSINLTLLVFNLLPALPLDGGRILRAALWAARDDFRWATRIAAGLGRAFGYGLIALGIAMLVFADGFSGVWLAFLGWFLLGAASAEARWIGVRDALGDRRVGDLMAREPVSVPPQMTLGEFMDAVVQRQRYTTYPVVEDGRPLGLLPFRRVAEVPRGEWDGRRVSGSMIARDDVPVLRASDPLLEALALLSGHPVGRALVVEDGGRLAGLLSVSDLARALEAGPPRRRP
jgi:Zn-dependent protease/CBS domain-containing protein